MAQRLKIIPVIAATVTPGVEVMHVGGRRDPALSLARHTERIGPQEHQPKTLPTATIPTLGSRATPLIVTGVALPAQGTTGRAHTTAHQASASRPGAGEGSPTRHRSPPN
ncbi:MAG TPA: hypothetical protein PL105_06870 [Caldilineaceae bacterium]|nr:hypothetical protein [Caldilineaceae bacterium]